MKHLENNWLASIRPCVGISFETQVSRKLQVSLNRLPLGSSRLFHGHIIEKTDPPLCNSCNAIKNHEHVLLHSQAFTTLRRPLINYFRYNFWEINLNNLLLPDFPQEKLTKFLIEADLDKLLFWHDPQTFK